MENYILDTNLFFNMEAGLDWGSKTEEVTRRLTEVMKKAKKESKAEFFMPPRIVEEYLSFFENKEQDFIKELLAVVTVKSPDVARAQIPASIFYQLVQDIRERSYRGLRVGEEELVRMAKSMVGKPQMDKKGFEIESGSVIKSFRERYRQATRFGFLDSLADLDLIVLAKVTDGFLVSTDEGVIKWGRVFGVKEMQAPFFGQRLKDYSA